MDQKKEIIVALAGNPNAGKTSIFNHLTGASQHVGNYPGVTVEKKEGKYKYKGKVFRVVDLPGIYSLTAFSQEEIVARKFLVSDQPDVVVDVVDSTNLDRNLYLAVQMMELGFVPVIALNFTDEARFIGQRLDLRILEERLDTLCIETIGNRGKGTDALQEAIFKAYQRQASPQKIHFSEEIETEIEKLFLILESKLATPFPNRYLATKLLEGDQDMTTMVMSHLEDQDELQQAIDDAIASVEWITGESPSILIGDQRHGFAAGLVREATISPPRYDRVSISDQVDSILTHRVLGLPVFFFFMYFLFWLTFTVGEYPMQWLEMFFNWLGLAVDSMWDSPLDSPVRSLIVDGIIHGVGGVIIFLPNILLLFLGIAALEDTGYMSRAAFIMDRIMHKIGLHGKSFIPMLIGFGCTVPAIMATRTLENMRDRLTTMMVLPLMSCGARLPIYMLIIPAFFPQQWHALMLWMVYIIGILLAALAAKMLRLTLLKGENAPFVMELPPYRLPTLKSVAIHMWRRAGLYLRKAGTIILSVSIVMWFASSYPKKQEFSVDQRIAAGETMSPAEIFQERSNERLEYSLAGRVGKTLEPVTRLMGFDWKISTAFVGAFVAKEVFVSQMGIVYSLGQSDSSQDSIRQTLHQNYPPLVGICIILFALIATPCMATVAATRAEAGQWKWALLQFGGLTLLAFLITVVVYQVGQLW
ncbi:ferrous iron transport protein B [candidate division CSSED10-310 bacterium]|uniref:Ferrous iron transport protein B n=1 Tax=candidate division CSSED10-310 bacterium TaxID=2855610 RepID=A0ABV6YSU5_UNCC1